MRICPLCKRKYESAETRFCPDDGQMLVADALPGKLFAASADAPFSGSLAMGLFAHRFLDATATGYTPPCQPSEVKVNDVRLYEHLPVIALWYLRENDRIRLTPVMKAGDFFVDFFSVLYHVRHRNQSGDSNELSRLGTRFIRDY